MFAGRLGLVFVVTALCLGGRTAHAQTAPVTYWTPGWLGFGGNLNAGQGANTDVTLRASMAAAPAAFPRHVTIFRTAGLSATNAAQDGLERHQPGWRVRLAPNRRRAVRLQFQNSPVSVYAGFDTLKYNPGIGGAFSPFDLTSSTVPRYGAHAGVEFKPTSNLSLSLGFGYTQQSGRIDTDTKSPSLSNASQVDLVGGWR